MNANGDKKLTKLFEPINIGHIEVKNRIAFAPTGMGTAGADGSMTDQSICHYTARAKGGAGLIIIEHSLCTLKHWKSGPAQDCYLRFSTTSADQKSLSSIFLK